MKLRLKKYDYIFFISVIVLILIGAQVQYFMTKSKGNQLVIIVKNERYGTYPLSNDRTIEIKTDGKITNIVVIKDGYAYMKAAKCPDHICMSMKKIQRVHESIVCLPNEVILTIEGGRDQNLDSISE